MKAYIDTGILVDYLAQGEYRMLREASRNGRNPEQLYKDAHELMSLIGNSPFEGMISALTFYEVEEALYKAVSAFIKGVENAEKIRLEACRPILAQALAVVRLFDLKVLGLHEDAVIAVSKLPLLAEKGIRVADALHVMTAANQDVEVIVSADRDILKLDGLVGNRSKTKMRCLDSDAGLTFLKSSFGPAKMQ